MDDERWMRRALELAERGRGTVSPNPMVGCVLVRDGTVVGEGFHRRAGEPHAEALAVQQAGAAAAGSTAYVTLEPCDHQGRTGPCSRVLIDAGVVRVVAATADPNPAAAGGAVRLRDAGIPVDIGCCGEEARRQNEIFFHALTHERPYVVVKAAVSLDGKVAAADGTSQWITSEQSRQAAHALRAGLDAVLVGSGTVLADDPSLTCRLSGYEGPQPLRVVLDTAARIDADRKVCDDQAATLIVVGPDAPAARVAPLQGAGVEVVEGKRAADRGLDPADVLALLWDRGVRSLLVEGGPRVASAFLRERLADKVVLHVAPLLLGSGGRALLVDDGIETLSRAWRLRLADVTTAGPDLLLTLVPRTER